MASDDGEDPLWKRILLNEMLLVLVAAAIILYVAFTLATGSKDEEGRSSPARPSPADGRHSL